jgi:hypothetical protein
MAAGVAERYPEKLAELLIANVEDPNELAAKLTNWRERRQHYRRAVAELSATLRAYTWRSMCARMLDLLEGVPIAPPDSKICPQTL